MTASRPGAAPGGWTWQLFQRGFSVIAVDNGVIDERLARDGTGEAPARRRLPLSPGSPSTGWSATWWRAGTHRAPGARWIAEGWCRETIFNLKLPMKKRWEESSDAAPLIDEALGGRAITFA